MKTTYTFIILAVSCFTQSCSVPLISEMQSARTVEKGELEITPGVLLAEDQIQGGVTIKTGIAEKTDFQLAVELGQLYDPYLIVERSDQTSGSRFPVYGFVNIGVKHAFIRNYLALNAPVGIYISNEYNAVGIGPSLIGTCPIIRDKIELSLAPKLSMAYADNYEVIAMIASFHSNLALSKDLNKWALRLEFSVMQGNNMFGGVGFSYAFSRSKQSPD